MCVFEGSLFYTWRNRHLLSGVQIFSYPLAIQGELNGVLWLTQSWIWTGGLDFPFLMTHLTLIEAWDYEEIIVLYPFLHMVYMRCDIYLLWWTQSYCFISCCSSGFFFEKSFTNCFGISKHVFLGRYNACLQKTSRTNNSSIVTFILVGKYVFTLNLYIEKSPLCLTLGQDTYRLVKVNLCCFGDQDLSN